MVQRISIVSSVPLTEPVIRNRLLPFFEEFTRRNVVVRCVCPKSELDLSLLPEGVIIDEVNINFKKHNSFLKRALQEARDARRLLKYVSLQNDKIVLVTIPSMFLAFFIPVYLRKKDVLLDIRDLSWEYLDSKLFVQKVAKLVFKRLFRYSLNFVKLVTATNKTEVAYIKSIKPGCNILHVSNGIRKQQYEQLEKVTANSVNKFTVSYIGNIGLAQDLSTLIGAAKMLPNIAFKIVGAGIDEQRITSLIVQSQLDNVEMVGRVSWDKLIGYYNNTHVLYAQLTPNFSGAMPSKLYEYLATGKKVIYAGEGQAVETLEEFENCTVIAPCDIDKLVIELKEIKKTMDRDYLSTKNQKVIKNKYIRENAARSFIEKVLV